VVSAYVQFDDFIVFTSINKKVHRHYKKWAVGVKYLKDTASPFIYFLGVIMGEFEEYKSRVTSPDRRKIRKLKQYKDLTDDQFNDIMDRKILAVAPVKAYEDRIERKLKQFQDDYDLSDMKINDMETLRALVQAILTLEDFEQYTFSLRSGGISFDNLTLLDKVGQQMSKLRADISKMQEDLQITRKIRKADEEGSVVNFLEDLKEKAKRFYEQKMSYIFCPKCNMLVATIWVLWPDGNNKLQFICNRKLDEGAKCGHKFVVTTSELKHNRGTNKPEVLPESMR